MTWTILSLNAGKVARFRAPDEPSAIAKQPLDGPIAIGPLGLRGDEQADPVNHGGPDKALHHYPRDHYPYWDRFLGGHALLKGEGALGENISTLGLTEETICLGDRLRLGTALVEVSHGRQPCWKLGHRFGNPQVTAEVVRTGKAGWYYRVLEPGEAAAGDALELVERPLPDWTVARVFTLVVGGGHRQDPAALRALAAQPVLAAAWRQRAERLLG